MSYHFDAFGEPEMREALAEVEQLGQGSACMEEAANELVEYVWQSFRDSGTGEPACALVRCFKTHRLSELPGDLRGVALQSMRGARADEGTPCLALLATRGLKPEWNSRFDSQGHRAIPLTSTAMLARAPMIARLVQQFGLEPESVVEADPGRRILEPHALNVFHVEEALGSEFVPIQAGFVEPMGICSVLGFGGLFPNGDLYCVLVFSRVRIGAETADRFRTLGPAVRGVLQGASGRVFAEDAA